MIRLYTYLITLIFTVFTYQNSLACHCSSYFEGVNNLSELESYDFVALVKITGQQNLKKTKPDYSSPNSVLKIEILEQFKGKKADQLFEHTKNTSCDLGITVGSEWVIFAKTMDGKLALSPCDRNVQYRDSIGARDWHFDRGFREIRDLKRLYEHPETVHKDGLNRKFYPNGLLEVEETYKDGKKNGEKIVKYPDGGLFTKQYYVNDSLSGKAVWFYPTGQIYDERFYIKGRPSNVIRIYYDSSTGNPAMKKFLVKDFFKTEDSLNFVYKRIQVHYERICDFKGREINEKEYSRLGKKIAERIIDPDRNFITTMYFHDNGVLSFLGYRHNNNDFGHTQEYDKNGTPTKSWDYDEKGILIKKK